MTLSERKTIDGELFEQMIFGGVANLKANLQKVNDLNVFPIPDGDTGENMYLTLQGGVEALGGAENANLGERAHAMAQGMLLGARGNSGVILSQLFYGISEGLEGLETADIRQFWNALNEGVKCAYGAVAHPVEGTILTVAREAAENIYESISDTTVLEEFFADYLSEMKKSLEKTPELLAVLKESGVIDSGGAGLVYIAEGFCKALAGADFSGEVAATAAAQKKVDFSKINADSVMKFGYCTEVLLQLQHAKTDIAKFSVPNLIEYLDSIGDSVVAFLTGSVVKIHVHTMTPWKVLQHCQEYGEFLTVKIENMTLQHSETHEEAAQDFKMPKRARRKFATVTVATGEGLAQVFRDMGADEVIYGGQTNNPSAEDFLRAFDEVNADHIFVLPNNGNVVLAAKQAANIYQDAKVFVIESKSVGQGYSALSMLDYGSDDAEEIAAAMTESMQSTVTGMVSVAVRSTTVNGVNVEKDDFIGFSDHTMLVSTKEKLQTACSLAQKMGVSEKEFVIVVYGNGAADEEKQGFKEYLSKTCPATELYEIDGGQEVYDFILIVE
ncbi:MAG: DAK2 domain-containing protein [Clostridia bacterium]|nr:DAK2 domain-containing protein [Clostridia bacterium]